VQSARTSANGINRAYLSIAGMVRRPTIAMSNFVLTESRNRRYAIVWHNKIAGSVTLPRASFAAETTGITRSTIGPLPG
jgi:hypothetical protein